MSSYPIAHKFPDLVIVIPPLHELLIDSSFSTLKEHLPVRGETPSDCWKNFRRPCAKACSHLRETKRSIIYIVVMVCPSLARSFTSSWNASVIAAWFAESGLVSLNHRKQ